MSNDTFTIQTMNRDELAIAVEWAAAEGWNPGLHDTDTYYTADPNGFLIGYLGEEPIATISAVKYGRSFGFIGFYIVKPEQRGKGYGLKIWNAALGYLEGCNIALDGVVEQQDNYRKSGFTFACRNVRYEGEGDGQAFADASLVDLSEVPFKSISSFSRPFFPEDRTDFVQAWINQPEAKAFGALQNGELAGYGVLRPCRVGYKVGPLFANTSQNAKLLFRVLKADVPKSVPIFLDVPQLNAMAVTMAEDFDMRVSFETARMYTGPAPELPWGRTFGLTSFEIG